MIQDIDKWTDKLAEDKNLISLLDQTFKKPSSKIMTSDISTQPPSNTDETIGSIFRQEHLQVPIPVQRHERYI